MCQRNLTGHRRRATDPLYRVRRLLVRAATGLAKAPARSDVDTGRRLLRLLAPGLELPAQTLASEGFSPSQLSREPARGGRW